LGEYVAWHTASNENDPAGLQSRRVRCASNLFWDVIGGCSIVIRLLPDGTTKVIDPEPVDGVLPGMDSIAFDRGDAAGACRFLADTIEGHEEQPKPPPDGPLFVANNFQLQILAALDGRAMTKDMLAGEVCEGEGSRLYKSGGINELKEAGLVINKPRLGYYRPDAPPPEKKRRELKMH